MSAISFCNKWRRAAACVREVDTVARLGGDEFVVMLEDLSDDPEDAANLTVGFERPETNLSQG